MADHITITPASGTVTVTASGTPLGSSSAALEMAEGKYPPVLYIPRSDVDMTKLERTNHSSTCPSKGEASYFSIVTPSRRLENAAWSYEDPLESMQAIAGHLAFYTDKVDVSLA